MSDYFPRKKKNEAYIVWKGRRTGIVETWAECEALTVGHPGSRFKGFTSRREAELVWNMGFDAYEAGRTFTRTAGPELQKPVLSKSDVKAITARAKMLVENFTGKDGSGQHGNTCTANQCTYPACQCR